MGGVRGGWVLALRGGSSPHYFTTPRGVVTVRGGSGPEGRRGIVQMTLIWIIVFSESFESIVNTKKSVHCTVQVLIYVTIGTESNWQIFVWGTLNSIKYACIWLSTTFWSRKLYNILYKLNISYTNTPSLAAWLTSCFIVSTPARMAADTWRVLFLAWHESGRQLSSIIIYCSTVHTTRYM